MDSRTDISAGRFAVLKHLEFLAALTDAERNLLSATLGPPIRRRSGAQLIALDAVLDEPVFILAGWACRENRLSDGRRQILDFYLPGELAGFSSQPGARAKAAYVCLTSCVTSSAGGLVGRVREKPHLYPGLSAAFYRIEGEVEQGLLDQISRTGAMRAGERMIDLIAELYDRQHRTGLADGFVMPLTQEILGDSLGVSNVHVNRTLQQLKRNHEINTGIGQIEMLEPACIAERAKELRAVPSAYRKQ